MNVDTVDMIATIAPHSGLGLRPIPPTSKDGYEHAIVCSNERSVAT
jgi:hypothetical protein